MEGIGFSRGGQFTKFSMGEGVHHRETFPVSSCGIQESNKEKTQKFTTAIYLQRYKTQVINDLLVTHLKTPSLVN